MRRYNHQDGARDRKPLPLRFRDEAPKVDFTNSELERCTALIQRPSGKPMAIELVTDSDHLATFFRHNWGADGAGHTSDATIYALRNDAASLGLSQEWEHNRWYNPASRSVWSFGSEYYGNVKITVRGLASEIASHDEMFVHGCALSVDGQGVVLAGMSGAGKTTLTSNLRRRRDVRIVNDDWGALELSSRLLAFTGEPRLHMKYASVAALDSRIKPSPDTHLSENYCGDPSDPHARLLISREEVFGQDGVADSVPLASFVVIVRDTDSPCRLARLDPGDVGLIERGQYSEFYSRSEFFLNGSLFLNEETSSRHRAGFERLIGAVPTYLLNNGGTPEEAVELLEHSLTQNRATDE